MWRPGDWKEIVSIKHGAIGPKEAVLFEAGADAMLEGLGKRGIPNDVYQCYLKGAMLQGLDIKQPYTYYGKKGTLVFIPEGE